MTQQMIKNGTNGVKGTNTKIMNLSHGERLPLIEENMRNESTKNIKTSHGDKSPLKKNTL